ncbi:MAG: aminotransferase class V-fold PLP-dependent enzyme [Bacteroidia bacterium]|nr:aminotransferase class V-fold PLP-dependent enzyme [Bacteroidia bacterium]NNJ56367.1 aminotransferase class V-fold PLP-dependent enzyme [Bacteroidia bacterium]
MNTELQLFNKLVSKLLLAEKNEPVVKPIKTTELDRELNLRFKDDGLSESEWEKLVEDVVLNTPRTATKLFFNQLFGGRQPKAVLGDLLAVVLNNSMYTYKVAGPQVGIEKAIMEKVCNLIGYENGDGTIAPGGSMCNFMAMVMGRDVKDNNARNHGVTSKMTLYTSAESHYSIPKNAAFMGVGRDHVRYINTNDVGEMDPVHLESVIQEDIEKGYVPFFVNATAGTTVLGAFDNIESISPICKKYKLWLHVDGAYCGGVIFSDKYKHLVKGIELSDSFSFNAHKMLGTPLSCSIIVTKDKEDLFKSFSNEAEYLYQTDADDFDLGKTSIQCGRRNDALKLWTLWKSVGNKGIEEMVDNQFYLADVAREYVSSHPNYTLYSHPESVSICFNYKDIPATTLCTTLYEDAATLVGYGKFGEDEFVRLVTINATNTKEDILRFFETLEKGAIDIHGKSLIQ